MANASRANERNALDLKRWRADFLWDVGFAAKWETRNHDG